MADPLSQLRQFHINGREIKEHNGYIIFGDFGWPKTVNTNYQIYSADDEKSKEYYTLECLLYFLKNMDVAHHHYIREAGHNEMPVVHRPDRKNLLAYLKGDQQSSPSIDKNAPIPALRLSTSEIYKLGQAAGSSAGTPGQSSSHNSSQLLVGGPSTSSGPHDTSSGGDIGALAGQAGAPAAVTLGSLGVSGPGIKRPHDPEAEEKIREEFAARLYEPSNKKMATIIPTEQVDKGADVGGSAISKLGAEKLAALRAKHLAVKRTTIVDADFDAGKSGPGATDLSSKEAELLIAMDSDQSKLIKSKEKIWRTRSSILQAQSKNFAKTVLPFVDQLTNRDPNRNKMPPAPAPTIPPDMQMNPYAGQQQQQQQQPNTQSQQQIQRNAYNRYDQERFVKLDIEIDTKKSFVSGVANGMTSQNTSQTRPNPAQPSPMAVPGGPVGGVAAMAGGGVPSHHHNGMGQDTLDSRHKMQAVHMAPPRPTKRLSTVPIIIIPATTTSLINMYNAKAILQDLTYSDGANKRRENEILIQRKKPDGTHVGYKVIDNPVKLDPEDWNRVVAVFVQGPAWQFKGWAWNGSPVEIFARIKGFHLKWDETKLDDNVAKWNVHVLELSRTKRHLDKANLLKFWSSLDSYMLKHKSFLKF